jgi:hypothetical protein
VFGLFGGESGDKDLGALLKSLPRSGGLTGEVVQPTRRGWEEIEESLDTG